jgi:ATP-dependent Clp protease protease subunit
VDDKTRSDWGDWLEGYLFDRRVTVVRGPLDDGIATRVATELMTLDATGDQAVTLQIDSPGGSLTAAFTLIDVIDVLGVPVNVLCMGRVEGSAVAVAAAGAHRVSLPHTQFKMRDPDVSFDGRASQVEQLARSQLELLARYHECLARCADQLVDEVARWCSEGRAFGAEEAKALGLVDEISGGRAPLRRIR